MAVLGPLAMPHMRALNDRITSDGPRVRERVATVMGNCGEKNGPACARPLATALQDSCIDVRRAAATAIGDLGPTAAAPVADVLLATLDDVDPWVREAAMRALARAGR